MELPFALRRAIEALTADYSPKQLAECVQALTRRYTDESGAGRRLLTKDAEAAAYCAARMPATFGAVAAALGWALECCDVAPETLLDVGAGTGAASWAVAERLSLQSVTCLEREAAMRDAGRRLMCSAEAPLSDAVWRDFDLTDPEPLPQADLVVESYVLNEMTEDMRLNVAERLWASAGQMLLLVEPGTPVASAQLRRIRSHLLAQGAHVAAPCPTEGECPMADGDWCHFQCRVSRSRLHRQLKGGDAPYEDEKFSYLALTRQIASPAAARILRAPYVEKGRITLTLCDGQRVSAQTIPRSDPRFRSARKADCGDAMETSGRI